MKIEVVEGIIRPRCEGGCDWDVEREVLVRLLDKSCPVKELWWMPGHTAWAGICCPRKYRRASLSLACLYVWSPLETVGGVGTKLEPLHEGRLSAKVIAQHTKRINDFFGADVAGLIRRGKMVVVKP